MAMKDWRRTQGAGINQTIWVNKKNGDIVRAFHKGKLFFYDVRDKDRFVMFENEAIDKKGAINLAKSYMRNH